MPNPVTIGITGLKKQSFSLSVDNGSVYQFGDHYFIEPNMTGLCTLNIKINKKKEYKYIFRVEQPEKPTARLIINKHDKQIKSVKESNGVYAIPFDNYDTELRVISYDVDIIRSDTLLLKHSNNGPVYDSSLKVEFNNLEKGDTVNFYNIIVSYKNGNKQEASPFSFVEK